MRTRFDRLFPWLMTAAVIVLPGIALSQSASRMTGNGVYSQAQAERGAAAYAQHCASCHGAALGGSDSAPPLAGTAFMANWDGQTADALFTRIKTTMPLDNPGSLGSATVTDIEAMLLARNDFPAGKNELPSDPSQQANIAISAAPSAQ